MTSDSREEEPPIESALGPVVPPNREPGTREHPNASRPRRDLEDRASVESQEDEGSEHLYGPHTLDGQAVKPHYLGNPRRGRQARNVDDGGVPDVD